MRIDRFLNVVPRPVQLWARALVVSGVLIGLVVGHHVAAQGLVLRSTCIGGGLGLITGSVVALWLLCLGYVFADARRRGMHPVLWVIVAGLLPHLLGFLLYFVMRQPIASQCLHCGMMISLSQRFCSWCGSPHTPSAPGNLQATANS
jgi:Phospholipase_D-nuclease N-terminal